MNKIIITICVLCMFMSCQKSSQINYIIRGTTVSIIDGKKVYLSRVEESDETIIDSTIIINNSFTFKGTQPKVCFAYVSPVGNIRTNTIVILENGIINVFLKKPRKVIGTPMNDILNSCNEKINIFEDELYALVKSRLNEDQEDKIATLDKKTDEILNKKGTIVKECINQNLDNIVGAYLLHKHAARLSNEDIIEILNNASPSMKESSFAQIFLAYKKVWELKLTEIGQKFTDFKMKDPNDKEIALSDYVGKGKYVLLDFWTSWCGPCRKEMPYLKTTYEKFKSKGFEIVGVSLDGKKEDWLKAIKDLGITWPQLSPLEEQRKGIYGVRQIPSTFLIDPNGIIIAKDLRGEAIEKKLSELLK